MPRLPYAFVLIVGLVAGALSGIIGTGSSIMLLPILVSEPSVKTALIRRNKKEISRR